MQDTIEQEQADPVYDEMKGKLHAESPSHAYAAKTCSDLLTALVNHETKYIDRKALRGSTPGNLKTKLCKYNQTFESPLLL